MDLFILKLEKEILEVEEKEIHVVEEKEILEVEEKEIHVVEEKEIHFKILKILHLGGSAGWNAAPPPALSGSPYGVVVGYKCIVLGTGVSTVFYFIKRVFKAKRGKTAAAKRMI